MVDETKLFDKRVALGIIVTSVLAALMFVTRAVMGANVPYSHLALIFNVASLAGVIPTLTYAATKVDTFRLPAIAWLHLTIAVIIFFFSDIYSPITPAWSILILLSSLYFSWRGFFASSFALVVLGVSFVIFQHTLLLDIGFINYLMLTFLIVVLTILISYLFVRVINDGRKKNRELVQAQKSELLQVNRLNTLLNSISDAVLTLNRYGRVTSQNAAAQVFFDTNESLIGLDIDKKLILKDESNNEISVHSLVDSVKSSSLRDDLSVGEGENLRHLSLQIARIRSTFGDNEEYGVVLIIRDITKQKTLEEEKDEFISVTSHELRTPVAIAEGSLSNFLLMQERGISQQKLTESAEAAHKQIVYLAQMINDLSTLSRAERGVGDDVEPININELLHNLYAKYTPEAEDKGLKLDLDAESHLPEIETSRLYLEEILQNFITNAIKYTKEGSVTFGAKTESDGYVRFFVRDTGIGMSKADIQHIFEKFYRSEDYRTRETSGTGLGLYVVEKLATKLGTKITVESRLNVGSTFGFVMAFKSHKLKKIEDKAAAATIQAETAEEPIAQAVS